MSATTIVVNDVEPRRQYTATGGQTVFDFPIPFFATDDLTVWLTPTGQTADDAADLLTLTTDYTVSGENTQDGGQVTLVVPATAGDIITIERIVDIERLADYQNSGDLLAETLNKEQDTEIFISQQLRQDIDRSVKRSTSSTSTADLTLPEPEALKVLRWKSDVSGLENSNGDAVFNGDAGDIPYNQGGTGSVTTDVESKLQERVSVADFGAVGDGVADDSAAIQAAIDAITPGLSAGGIVSLNSGRSYKLVTGLIIPSNVTLDCRGALITYTGTGTAITLGDSDTVLTYHPKVINLNLKQADKTSTGARLRGTNGARVHGYIEGYTAVIDNTRTNIGVDIDGVNISSFFNVIEVECNHVHESFKIHTSGTTDPTNQLFLNCSAFGDQASDNTSIGYSFDGSNFAGEGTVILGGNVEMCNTGVKFGAAAGRVTVNGLRTEINVTGTSWKFDFVNGCDPVTLIGIHGLGNTYMESNSGIRNWDSNNHVLMGSDDNGSLRLAGFDKALNNVNFIGLGGTNPQMWFDDNADLGIMLDSDNTGTGRIFLQAGRGSSNTGAGYIAHSASHASNPGDLFLFADQNGGNISIRQYLGGPEVARFERIGDLSANQTNLYLYDFNTSTVQSVTVGAADSGGVGFKVLRIPN